MKYEVIVTPRFKRDIKKLSKKYPSLKSEFASLIDASELNPKQGISLGSNCYIRILKIG